MWWDHSFHTLRILFALSQHAHLLSLAYFTPSTSRHLSKATTYDYFWNEEANRLRRDLAQLETLALVRVDSAQCLGASTNELEDPFQSSTH